MTPDMKDYILWAMGAVAALLGAYAKRIQIDIRDERRERKEDVESLNTRINTMQLQVAAFEGTHAALQRLELQLINLSQLTHRIAGHLGID